MRVDWPTCFDEIYGVEPGATEEDIARLLDDLRRPLSESEIEEALKVQRNPWPVNHPMYASYEPLDPSLWKMPGAPPPDSFLDFLRWADGVSIVSGEREFGFFSTDVVREYVLSYQFPYYVPGAIPIGLDGEGNFAVFDTRQGLDDGEYPILFASSRVLDYGSSPLIARTFEEFCRGRNRIADLI